MDTKTAPIGLRERNKTDKLRRIRAAARTLFWEQGFQETSMRDIAHHSHVGLATLFLYAENKRDLLFLAFSEDLDELTKRPFDRIDTDQPILDQLEQVFEHFFVFYDRNRDLARDLLREISIYTSGRQSQHFQATREATVAGVERLIAAARRRGTIAPKADDSALAHLVFDVFTNALRHWLGQNGPLADGLSGLRKQFRMLIDGFGPAGIDAGPARPRAKGGHPRPPAQNFTEPVTP